MVKLTSCKFISAKTVQGGETLEIMNEGGWVLNQKFTYPDGNPKQDFQMKVHIGDEERILNVNKTNRDTLAKAWGEETKDWIGKKCRIRLIDALVSGKMIKVIILEPQNGINQPQTEVPWDK